MTDPTREDPLFILAMDHRDSFAKLLGAGEDPTPDETRRLEAAKGVIYDGLLLARDRVTGGTAGVLVDEQYGSREVARAEPDGIVLAVPIEKSGQEWFATEWGDAWLEHVRATHPDFSKVLVRDNPDLDADERAGQFARLRAVVDGLADAGVPLIIELLVPATDAQLASVGGDADRYDAELRAALTVRSIGDFYAHGIVPRLWKVEGLESTDDAASVVEALRQRPGVDAIVLGRDAPRDRLAHWLTVAARVPGFVGFAIGRSIWEQALRDRESSSAQDADAAASDTIADAYLGYVDVWNAARP